MSKRKNADAPAASGTVQIIPLNRLKKSPRNARKTPHPKADIEALAASIAVHGMLQSPVVEPETKDGKATGYYLVTIGEGRRQAQLLRVKRKQIAKTEPIRCIVETAHDAFEISLAENAIRSPMHPADQFDAFHALHTEKGMSAEDIAARFGVTPAVVKQRLKLAAVSPALIAAYRAEEMTLDQLSAFAVTDDTARQEAVWNDLGQDADRSDILAALNEDHIAATDRRAVFVGIEAYREAGGSIRRDLFDEDDEGFFTDAGLLLRLAQEKLQVVAVTVKAEGWKWVEIMPQVDHSAVAAFRRVYPQTRELSEDEQEKLAALEAEYEELALNEQSEAVETGLDRLEQAMAAIRGEDAFDPAAIARAGAIVSIGYNGEPSIERGYVRAEDDIRAPHARAPAKTADGPAALSEKLVAELTAYRTMALRDVLGVAPDLALIAVVHALAASVFFPHSGAVSCLRIRARCEYLGSVAPDIHASKNAVHLQERHERWAGRMPENPADLWDFVSGMTADDRLSLLAHCAGLTVDAVQRPKDREAEAATHHAAQLFTASNKDMAMFWEPTAKNYLGRVSKDRILEAVREGVSKEAAENLASMKKQAMAEAAEQRLRGKDWLPEVLRFPAPPAAQAQAA
jgi:ParB family chromosome partitioning protein